MILKLALNGHTLKAITQVVQMLGYTLDDGTKLNMAERSRMEGLKDTFKF